MTLRAGQKIREGDFIRQSEKTSPGTNADKVPRLESTDKLHNDFIDFQSQKSVLGGAGEAMDGSSTPIAALLKSNGNIYKADANVTARQAFSGFVKELFGTTNAGSFLNQATATGETLNSFVANAGVQRVAFAVVFAQSGAVTVPASVTYNGNAMTFVDSIIASSMALSIWSYPIGDNVSNDAAVNIVASTFVGTFFKGIAALVYEDVNQTTPVGAKAKNSAASTTSVTVNLTPNSPNSRVLAAHNCGTTITTLSGSQTQRTTQNGNASKTGDVINASAVSTNYGHTASVTTNLQSIAIEINSGTINKGRIHTNGIIDGFSNLTPGSIYYVSDTEGAVSTTPGTLSIKIGRAVSTTEILITE